MPGKDFDFPLFDIIADTEEIMRTIQGGKLKDIARAKMSSIVSGVKTAKIKLTIEIHNKTKQLIIRTARIIIYRIVAPM